MDSLVSAVASLLLLRVFALAHQPFADHLASSFLTASLFQILCILTHFRSYMLCIFVMIVSSRVCIDVFL